jgi:hypothetical protein
MVTEEDCAVGKHAVHVERSQPNSCGPSHNHRMGTHAIRARSATGP